MDHVIPTNPRPEGQIQLTPLIREARASIKGSKRTYFVLVVAYGLIFGGLSLFLPGFGVSATLGNELLYLLLLVLTAAPIGIAVTTVALRRAAGTPVSTRGVFAYMRYYPQFVLVALIPLPVHVLLYSAPLWVSNLATGLLGAATGFSIYYILDRDYSLVHAITSSVRLFARNLPQLFMFWLLTIVLMLAAVLTLGIGLIWLLPFMYTAHALMYAQVNGLERFASGEYQSDSLPG